jgi:hypothetical protein
MLASARGGTLIPVTLIPVVIASLAIGCAASLIAAVIWLTHHDHATASTRAVAGTTALVDFGPPWTGPPWGASSLWK